MLFYLHCLIHWNSYILKKKTRKKQKLKKYATKVYTLLLEKEINGKYNWKILFYKLNLETKLQFVQILLGTPHQKHTNLATAWLPSKTTQSL